MSESNGVIESGPAMAVAQLERTVCLDSSVDDKSGGLMIVALHELIIGLEELITRKSLVGLDLAVLIPHHRETIGVRCHAILN